MNYIQVGVKAIIQREDKFLIIKNNPDKYKDFSKWSIPGGRINYGESLEHGLRREIKEETNLNLSKVQELISAQEIIKKDIHIVRLTYRVEAIGKIKLSYEHIDYEWITLSNLQEKKSLDKYLFNILDKL
jgi:8-oxo-dGTP diphosphatase